jgi:hypothetical protein
MYGAKVGTGRKQTQAHQKNDQSDSYGQRHGVSAVAQISLTRESALQKSQGVSKATSFYAQI